MEIVVKIQGTEGLERAIIQLAHAISVQGAGNLDPIAQYPSLVLPVQQPQTTQAQQPTAPLQQPAQMPQFQHLQVPQQFGVTNQPANAVQPIAQAQQLQIQQPVVPTSHTAQSYTQDQLAVAMTALCDSGKLDAVMGILAQFGAETLMQVPKEQYSALATMLRGAGANI